MQMVEILRIWERIADLVIKSILSGIGDRIADLVIKSILSGIGDRIEDLVIKSIQGQGSGLSPYSPMGDRLI